MRRGSAARPIPSPRATIAHQGLDLRPNDSHAITGSRLVLSNRSAAVDVVLDLRSAPEERTLAGSAAYREARRAAGEDGIAGAFVDLAALRRHPGVTAALAGGREPLVAAPLAGILDALRESRWLSACVRLEGGALVTACPRTAPASIPGAAAAFALPAARGRGTPAPRGPRGIAGFSLHRDLHGFYAAKDTLFPSARPA